MVVSSPAVMDRGCMGAPRRREISGNLSPKPNNIYQVPGARI